MSTIESGSDPTTVTGAITSKSQVVKLLSGLVDDLQVNYVLDRRQERRYPLCIPVDVAKCDSRGQRSGEAFTAVTKDISAGGMAFLHRFPIGDQLVEISFPGSGRYAGARLILLVIRRRAVGPFWEIAGRFVFEPDCIEQKAEISPLRS
jgi:hypothetical protein